MLNYFVVTKKKKNSSISAYLNAMLNWQLEHDVVCLFVIHLFLILFLKILFFLREKPCSSEIFNLKHRKHTYIHTYIII